MGWMISNIKCPKCGSEEAEESLHNSLEYKEIRCPECGYKKDYEIKNEWIETEED